MSAVDDARSILGLASDAAPVLLEIEQYIAGDHRDASQEVALGMAVVRRIMDARAEREIETAPLASSMVKGPTP